MGHEHVTEAISPRLQGAELVVGGKESLKRMKDIASKANRQLDVDLFSGSHTRTLKSLAKSGKGLDSLFLADPEVSSTVRATLADTGNVVVDVGPNRLLKNHAKSVVADGQHAYVTTAALAPRTPERFEVGAVFSGDAGRAMSELTRASATHDPDAIRLAADKARGFGIIVNDAQYGIWNLSEEVRELVTGAERRLIVATKRLEEPGIRQLIDDARKRGVDVDIAPLYGDGMNNHANIVVADDAAYLGSGHLTKRVLTGGGSNGRIARELGLVIEDLKLVDELVQALEAQGFLGQSGAAGGGLSKNAITGLVTGGVVAAAAGVVALKFALDDDEPTSRTGNR